MPILELLAGSEDVDPNLADNDGNTPLIFAAQAGKNPLCFMLLVELYNMH
jgi:ankyrin repeat protein